MSDNKITCPNCGHAFDVEEALSGKLEAHFKAEYEKKVSEQAERFRAEREKLETEKEAFREKKERENELFKEKLEEQINREKAKIKDQTRESFEVQMKALQEEIDERKKENRQLKEQEIELKRRENKMKEREEELEMKIQRELLEKQKEIEEKARAMERESMALKEKEYIKQLEDQKKLIDEMKRKSEQGSMQMQGEVQELALEELLTSTYPFDTIEEVPKGVRGADCIQTVINARQQACGSIVYESKRTKSFTSQWIDKLKQDQLQCKADLAVIVTEVYPADMIRFGEKDGVWICGFHEVQSLSFVLREMLIRMQAIRSMEENKGEKADLLYDYLTSNEFVQRISFIVENYDAMRMQIQKEKRAMQSQWKEREKQLDIVQMNIASLFGSIKGIAGKELPTAYVLELPEETNEDE